MEQCISRIRTKLDPDNLEASLDKFKFTERGYKLEKIKRGFLKALKFERKELIAERSQNKQTPLVCKYHPHLQNFSKTITKGWDRIYNSDLKQLIFFFFLTYACVQTHQKHQRNISRKWEERKKRGWGWYPSPTQSSLLTPGSETTQPRPETDCITLTTHTTPTEYPSIRQQVSLVLPWKNNNNKN